MKKMPAAILAVCVICTFGFILIFNNSSGSDTPVSQTLPDTTSETEISADTSPFTDREPSTSTTSDDFSIMKEEFQQLTEEEQDRMMEEFVAQFWEVELGESDETAQPEHRLSLDIFNRPYMQTITERDFWQLSPEDQEKAMAETIDSARQTRARTQDIIAQAKLDMADNDYVRAEAYLLHALETGRELSANKEGMFITRVVGISCEKAALNEMAKLYGQLGEHSRVQMVQEQLQAIEMEMEDMRSAAKESEAR